MEYCSECTDAAAFIGKETPVCIFLGQFATFFTCVAEETSPQFPPSPEHVANVMNDIAGNQLSHPDFCPERFIEELRTQYPCAYQYLTEHRPAAVLQEIENFRNGVHCPHQPTENLVRSLELLFDF